MFSSSLLKLNHMRLGVFQKHSCGLFTLVIISDLLLNANSVIIFVQTYTLSFNNSNILQITAERCKLRSIFRGISNLKVR